MVFVKSISRFTPPMLSYNRSWVQNVVQSSSAGKPVNNFVDADIASMIFHTPQDILTDVKRVADPAHSYACVLNDPPEYRLGERIIVNVNLRNGFGDKLTTGGDEVRVMMKGKNKDAGLAGHVTDHNNGSYTAHVIAGWTGQSDIKIYILPKEIKNYFQHVRNDTIPRVIYGGFRRGKTIRYTACDTRSNILLKMYPQICNLTTANYGIGWYCGKPDSLNVSCSDWSTNQHQKQFKTPNSPPINETADEIALISK